MDQISEDFFLVTGLALDSTNLVVDICAVNSLRGKDVALASHVKRVIFKYIGVHSQSWS